MSQEQGWKMSKVFIIEPLKSFIDTSSAEKFGDIEYLFKPNERRVGVFDNVRFGQAVLKQLVDCHFNFNDDYICVVGSVVTLSVSLVAIAQEYNEFKVLLFNSSSSDYVERIFRKSDWKGQSNV